MTFQRILTRRIATELIEKSDQDEKCDSIIGWDDGDPEYVI